MAMIDPKHPEVQAAVLQIAARWMESHTTPKATLTEENLSDFLMQRWVAVSRMAQGFLKLTADDDGITAPSELVRGKRRPHP